VWLSDVEVWRSLNGQFQQVNNPPAELQTRQYLQSEAWYVHTIETLIKPFASACLNAGRKCQLKLPTSLFSVTGDD
jgi:hypothetical protein